MDLATVSDERRAELLFAFDVLVAEGEKRGYEKGFDEGHEKGFDEGEKHGKRQTRIEMAQKLLAEGLGVEQVMRLTGLSRDEAPEWL
jgi:predicted transposase/invertase (TIGR01784 family)